jgi:3-deoxy-8-phosphooctulonate synthase
MDLSYLKSDNFFLLAGPCVIEEEDMTLRIAERLKIVTDKLSVPLVFKGSFRKANRSRVDSFTGIGDQKALKILRKVHDTFQIPTVTDIHESHEAAMAAEYVDVLQIPAFLCRQTELLVAAAKTGKVVNIKKGQFLSPEAMKFAAQKVTDSGNEKVILTERGGGGTIMRGPGETQLETDRRIILDKISRLKQQLKDIDKQKTVQRKNRGKLVRVALVGYTNVGKSTLMTLLSKSEVFAENKLFATLDTTVRKVTVKNDLMGYIEVSDHYRRLVDNGAVSDAAYCLTQNSMSVVPVYNKSDGKIY